MVDYTIIITLFVLLSVYLFYIFWEIVNVYYFIGR